jgi:hypothetical protein
MHFDMSSRITLSCFCWYHFAQWKHLQRLASHVNTISPGIIVSDANHKRGSHSDVPNQLQRCQLWQFILTHIPRWIVSLTLNYRFSHVALAIEAEPHFRHLSFGLAMSRCDRGYALHHAWRSSAWSDSVALRARPGIGHSVNAMDDVSQYF